MVSAAGIMEIASGPSLSAGAGGFILPNDHVDVILTRRETDKAAGGSGDSHSSETILTNVRVLAIDQAVEEKNGQKVVVGKTATLELTPGQSETLAVSQQLGSLSLALRSITDATRDEPQSEEKSNSRKNGVNVVRFGVGTVTTTK